MGAPSERAVRKAAEVLELDTEELPHDGGYLDLVGAHDPPAGSLAQLLMRTRIVPSVYERWWRPALGRVVKGPRGPSMAQEERLARDLLALGEGATVLDVACGPGNFTRTFAREVGEHGTVIGIDISAPMLDRAARDTHASQVVYIRSDVATLRVRAGSVDAVCCFAALHLFSDPWTALDVMARALVPGGRLALLTTSRPTSLPPAQVTDLLGRVSGVRMFGVEELARALADRGLEVFQQRTFGLMQIVGARRPSPPNKRYGRGHERSR
ncbi:MAG: class I SAM-dependent methyltransferase [Nitriliruptorales bacterium]